MRRIGVRGKEQKRKAGRMIVLTFVCCQRKERRQEEKELGKTGKRNTCRDGKGKNNWLNRCVKSVVFLVLSSFSPACMENGKSEWVFPTA